MVKDSYWPTTVPAINRGRREHETARTEAGRLLGGRRRLGPAHVRHAHPAAAKARATTPTWCGAREKTVLIDTVDPTHDRRALRPPERGGAPRLRGRSSTWSRTTPARCRRCSRGTPRRRCSAAPGPWTSSPRTCTSPATGSTSWRMGEELALGGKTLRFVYTPWAHWPETMSTFIPEDKVLLTCDMFGSHLATSDLIGEEDRTLPGGQALLRRDHDAVPPDAQEEPGEGGAARRGGHRAQPRADVRPAAVHLRRLSRVDRRAAAQPRAHTRS